MTEHTAPTSETPAHLIDREAFPLELARWSKIIGICSLPNFILALKYYSLHWSAILAMLFGVGTFILAYTLLTSTYAFQRMSLSAFGQGIRIAAKFRVWCALLSLVLVLLAVSKVDALMPLTFWSPDFWNPFRMSPL